MEKFRFFYAFNLTRLALPQSLIIEREDGRRSDAFNSYRDGRLLKDVE